MVSGDQVHCFYIGSHFCIGSHEQFLHKTIDMYLQTTIHPSMAVIEWCVSRTDGGENGIYEQQTANFTAMLLFIISFYININNLILPCLCPST